MALHPVDLLDAATGAGEDGAGRGGCGGKGFTNRGLLTGCRAPCLLTSHAG